MFSEIRKTISSGCVSKMDIGFGSLSFTVNVRLPTPISIFGAAGRVPADGARYSISRNFRDHHHQRSPTVNGGNNPPVKDSLKENSPRGLRAIACHILRSRSTVPGCGTPCLLYT